MTEKGSETGALRPDPKPELRQLVSCAACEVQYDASSRPPGSQFHCGCGELIQVPRARVHDASVVRCSSCGGPRHRDQVSCSFCGADFTLHERDLHTICPDCCCRIPDRARFCHHCGTPITPAGPVGPETDYSCPVCQDSKLCSRSLGGDDLSVLECGKCGGLWIGHELFVLLQERARTKQLEWLDPGRAPSGRTRQKGPLYRSCVVCGRQMSRRNFQGRSGVIIDVCPADGIWLDLGELDRVLRWIDSGQQVRAERREAVRQEREEMNRRLRGPIGPLERAGWEEFGGGRQESPDFVSSLIELITRP